MKNLKEFLLPAPQRTAEDNLPMIAAQKSAIIGAIFGGYIGYLLRPSIPVYGQLSFETVISRGAHLRGFEQLFVPAAQLSFNYIIAGIIIGAFIGLIVYGIYIKKDTK